MSSPLQQRLRMIDELCDQYEADWRAHHPSPIQVYLEGVDEPVRQALLYELVLLDQELSREFGENWTLQDYRLSDSDKALLFELSTDLLVVPSPASLPETHQVTESSPTGTRNQSQLANYPQNLDPALLRQVAPGSDHSEESRTSIQDLPSTVGGDKEEDAPAGDETAAEDVPSTMWTSPADRIAPDGLSATCADKNGSRSHEPPTLPSGQRLGDYELIEKLAQGGMGIMYKARQISLNRIVALKMIRAGAFATDREIRLFQSEAEAIAALDHPGIVPILEVSEHDGHRYYSMKLIDGQNLHDCRKRFEGRFPAIAHLVAQIADAVHHAHLRGVLHRDLKPANILIDAHDQPRVVDWGLAKRLETDGDPNSTTAVAGTPSYMSPEQARGQREAITTATDVYGLGTILYAMLTQRAPFQAGTTLQTLRRVIDEEPKRPRAVNPQIDADLETICLKCLEKDPQGRYHSARELADDLSRWIKGEPILARPVPTSERLLKWARRHPAISGLVLLVHLVALAGLSGVFWQWGKAVEAREELRRALATSRVHEAEALQNEDLAAHLAYAAKLNLGSRDWADANIGHLQKILEDTRPQPGSNRDLRGFEWYYLDQLCRQARFTLVGHGEIVGDVAYNTDGTKLATASFRAVRLWDAKTGQLIRLIPFSKQVYAVSFHPDGKRLIAGGNDQELTLWDLVADQVIRKFYGHTASVQEITFSPDGSRIASSSLDGRLLTWETETGKILQTQGIHADGGRPSITFSPDGKRLFTSSDDAAIAVWDLTTGRIVQSLIGPDKASNVVVSSQDGHYLASSTGHSRAIHLWDAKSARILRTFYGRLSEPWCLAFSPNSKYLASAGPDQMITLWEISTGNLARTFKGHAGGINSLAFSPDNQWLASASSDATAKVWNVTQDQETQGLTGHTDIIQNVAFSPNGKFLASACRDQTVRVWALENDHTSQILQGHGTPVRCVRFSPDSRRLASGGDDKTVKLWDLSTGQPLRTLQGHTGTVWRIVFGPDGDWLASAGDDHTVRLWNSATGAHLQTLVGHTEAVNDLAISPDGKTLVSAGNDGNALLWNIATGRGVQTIKAHLDGITAVAFSPDGKSISTSGYDRLIKVWDTTNGQLSRVLTGHSQRATALAYSPDGRRLVSASTDQTLRIWDPGLGEELSTLKSEAGALFTAAFSPDGNLLAAGGYGRIVKLWSASTGQPSETRPGAPER